MNEKNIFGHLQGFKIQNSHPEDDQKYLQPEIFVILYLGTYNL